MGKAEVGTPKYIANQMKAKGLQRLRWYCQVCEKQCRDENGFKCHTQSESHVRRMLEVGDKAKESIEDYSKQFLHDFVYLLRTGHGEKPVNANRFYQEYIANKNHIHMNATKWTSLTDFIKYLGTQGVCRVREDETAVADSNNNSSAAVTISWIDNSPETMRRKEALKKKERAMKDDDSTRQKLMDLQIKKAREALNESSKTIGDKDHKETNTLDTTTNTSLKINIVPKQTVAVDPTETNKNVFAKVSNKPKLNTNVFKVAKSKSSAKPSISALASSAKKPSALQRIMLKDQAHKKSFA